MTNNLQSTIASLLHNNDSLREMEEKLLLLREEFCHELSKRIQPFGLKVVPIEEIKYNVSEKSNNPKINTPSSEDFNKKTRSPNIKIVFEGTEYRSAKEACEDLGISYATWCVKKRSGRDPNEIISDLVKIRRRKDSLRNSRKTKVKKKITVQQDDPRFPLAATLVRAKYYKDKSISGDQKIEEHQ